MEVKELKKYIGKSLDKFLINIPCKTKIALVNKMGDIYYYGKIKNIPDKQKNLYFYKVVDFIYTDITETLAIEIETY